MYLIIMKLPHFKPNSSQTWEEQYKALEAHHIAETTMLIEAIKKHHDARGHDRCWENDLELYSLIGLSPEGPEIPNGCEFAARCKAYYEQQTGRNDFGQS